MRNSTKSKVLWDVDMFHLFANCAVQFVLHLISQMSKSKDD